MDQIIPRAEMPAHTRDQRQALVRRMADDISEAASNCGICTMQDLTSVGWTAGQVALYGGGALALVQPVGADVECVPQRPPMPLNLAHRQIAAACDELEEIHRTFRGFLDVLEHSVAELRLLTAPEERT